MHLILTGATGLIGASVLHTMLNNPGISRISILSRQPVKQAESHPKAKTIIHEDFKTYPTALREELKDAHGCVWALGVSQNDVDEKKYIEITKEYAIEAAKAFASMRGEEKDMKIGDEERKPEPFTFVFVSGEGATQTPGMFTTLYGRVKGQTESALLDLSKNAAYSNLRPYMVRPGAVDWTTDPAIHPYIPNQALYKKMLIPGLNVLWKGLMTPTQVMGRVCVDLAMGDGKSLQGNGIEMEGRILTNAGIRRMAGLSWDLGGEV